MIFVYVLLMINIITTLGVCFCAGAMLSIKDDIDDRIVELSMIETHIVSMLPDNDEKGDII